MRANVLLPLLMLAACASPQTEAELRRTPWERADFRFTRDLQGTGDSILAAARKCFDGKRINLTRTFVHREPSEDGGYIITAFQLGTYDAAILVQMDVHPTPEGSKVALFRSASLRLGDKLAPFVERWVAGEAACPSIL